MPTPNPGTRREHKGAAVPATLVTAITVSDTSFTISTNTGWPTGAVGPFFVVIDPGKPSEEKILCASQSASVCSVAGGGRGVDGTTAATHLAGAVVYPVWTGIEADEANAHAAAISAVHGVAGAVVGTTDAQALTNKTISGASNSLSAIPSAAVTGVDAHIGSTAAHGALVQVVGLTNTQVLSNKTIDGGTNTLQNIPQTAVTGLSGHTHDFAATTHNHDTAYSATSHTHTGFAASTHNHDTAYSATSHTHTGFAATAHTHDYAATSHLHDTRYALYTTGETYGKVAERTVNWSLGTGRVHGEVVSGAGTYYAVWVDGSGLFARNTSSRRYKENIRDHDVDPGDVLALQPRFFDRIGGDTEYGMIAEEVAETLPEIVVRDENGVIDGVRYDLLAVALLDVVKDQQKRIEALEAALLGPGGTP